MTNFSEHISNDPRQRSAVSNAQWWGFQSLPNLVLLHARHLGGLEGEGTHLLLTSAPWAKSQSDLTASGQRLFLVHAPPELCPGHQLPMGHASASSKSPVWVTSRPPPPFLPGGAGEMPQPLARWDRQPLRRGLSLACHHAPRPRTENTLQAPDWIWEAGARGGRRRGDARPPGAHRPAC